MPFNDWTPEMVDKHNARIAAGKNKEPEPTQRPVPQYRSNVEAIEASNLYWLQKTGKIVDYVYESLKFTLAHKTSYKPDFTVFHNDGSVEVIETKGGRMHKETAIRFKVAAERYNELKWTMKQYKDNRWITKMTYDKGWQ